MNNSLEKFAKVINELQRTNSATEKINILSQYNNDVDICKYFYYAYNPFYLYGVSSKNLKKNCNLSELEFFKNIFELLDLLRTRQVTGNKAIALVNCFINQNNKYEELLYNFFDRNLNIGMAVKQINKALGNIIPTFDVALAATYDESKKDKYNLDNYIIERKMNGCVSGDTLLQFDDGSIKSIKEIVDNKLVGNVKSYNTITKKVEYKPITNWFLNKSYTEDGKLIKNFQWFKIYLEKPLVINGEIIDHIKVTGNHLIWCENLKCYRRVDELDGTETLNINI